VEKMSVSRLFKKALIIMMILFGIVATTTSLLSGWNLYTSLTDEFKSKGAAIARSIADSSVEILLNRDASTIQATIDQFLDIKGVSYVFVLDAQRQVISHTFVPAIPAEVFRLREDFSTSELREETGIKELHIKGFGDVIDISFPILAGVAGRVHVGMDKQLIRHHILSVVIRQQGLIFVIFLVSIVLAYLLVSRISQPLKTLTEHAKKLASYDFSAEGPMLSGDIQSLTLNSRDEVGELAESFVYMEQELRKSIKNLTATTAAKERIENELKIARTIQMSMIPKIFPPFPNRPEFELYAVIEPAKEVGGDFYDFFFIDDDHLYFVIGDVSDKGVPASLFMAVTKTLIRSQTSKEMLPDEVLRRVNQDLCVDNDSNMFVTVFCGVLHTRTGEVWYSNGGHNPPYLLTASGEVVTLERTGGMVLGVMEDIPYQTKRITLRTGDGLFMFTDGITEAMNCHNQLFSDARLRAVLHRINGASSIELIRGVVGEVERFAAGAPQSDDITALALLYRNGA
jgi:serine phosphatase RsbU (regulator of sigma subunit)